MRLEAATSNPCPRAAVCPRRRCEPRDERVILSAVVLQVHERSRVSGADVDVRPRAVDRFDGRRRPPRQDRGRWPGAASSEPQERCCLKPVPHPAPRSRARRRARSARGAPGGPPTCGSPRSSRMASRKSGFRPACLTLYSPPIWRATSSESFTTSTSSRAQLAGQLEPEQQRAVLRHVVRGLADVELALAELLAVGRRWPPRPRRPGRGCRARRRPRGRRPSRARAGGSIAGKLPFGALAATVFVATGGRPGCRPGRAGR